MDYPKISIVTPNYNNAQYIEQTIFSVLSQNYPNLEYIIIDGGSTDGSVDIIKKYEEQLTYWVSEPDSGMYYAIKKGFEHSSGDIMAWIGSDDMYHHDALFVVAEIFSQHPEVNWLVGVSTCYDECNRTVFVKEQKYFSHLSFLMYDFEHIQQESTFWRKNLYDKVGGISTSYRLAGDFDLWMRFSRCEKLYIVNALIGGFRVSDVQLSKNVEEYRREAEGIIAKEPICDADLRLIKIIKWKKRLITLLKYFRILNWQSLEYRLLKNMIEEGAAHCLHYDFVRKEFVL